MAQVISAFGIPVRTRLSWQPTLAAATPCSFAIATMWHCGLPCTTRSGSPSASTISWRPVTRSSTTSGSIGVAARGP